MTGDGMLQPPQEAVLVEGHQQEGEAQKLQPLPRREARARYQGAGPHKEDDGRPQGPGQGEHRRVVKAYGGGLTEDIGTRGADHMQRH